MPDPEILYSRLTSGDAGAVRERSQTLRSVVTSIDAATDDVHAAAAIPVWTGLGADAFGTRTSLVAQGAVAGQVRLGIARDVLQEVASAYDDACTAAEKVIAFWRDRPADMEGLLERLLRALVCLHLKAITGVYAGQLAAGAAVLTGDAGDLDLDALDEETRAWVERGLDRTQDWLDDYDSSTGPLIPNTKATGDGRNLVPQGLGYDPASGLLLQTYYDKDEGDLAVLSLIDPRTGEEVGEVQLTDGDPRDPGPIGHAGGVTVDGDEVHISSGGKIWTYALDDIRDAGSGGTVGATRDADVSGAASYTAFHDGRLYVGDFDHDRLYVYEKGRGGTWVPSSPPAISTPPRVQGVVVRDDGFIYSTSEGRTQQSTVVVQSGHGDYDADAARSYDFPTMSEGIVEVDGQLVTTYESGAGYYQHPIQSLMDKILGRNGDDDLWASPHMTSTPLTSLGLTADGLSGELEAEPASLRKAATALEDPAADLKKAAATLDGVTLPAHLLGEVPSAGAFAGAVTGLVSGVADAVQTSSAAVTNLAAAVDLARHHYTATDAHARGALGAVHGRLP